MFGGNYCTPGEDYTHNEKYICKNYTQIWTENLSLPLHEFRQDADLEKI